MRILTRFNLIATTILGLITAFIGYRLCDGPLQWALLMIPAVLVWVLPVFVWSSDADAFTRRQVLLQQASFVSMGLMSWLLVLTVLPIDGLTAFPAAIGLSALGGWRALRGPRSREVEIAIDGLPQSLDGLRIAQITDLHVGPTIGRSYVQGLVDQVQALKPDVTVLTGDIVDGNVADLRQAVEPLRELEPKSRVYYVPGNHEYYWTIQDWLPELQRLGIEPLLNRGRMLDRKDARIWIGGITDPAAAQFGEERPNVSQATQGSDGAGFKLLLSHRPQFASQAARAGFHLQLSGHTHGGQFFPWTFIAKLVHRHLLVGRVRVDGMWVYVSPGTGTWGPPVRIGTTPEVSLIKLRSSPTPAPARS